MLQYFRKGTTTLDIALTFDRVEGWAWKEAQFTMKGRDDNYYSQCQSSQHQREQLQMQHWQNLSLFFQQRRAGESDYGLSRPRRYDVRTELRSGDVFVGTVA